MPEGELPERPKGALTTEREGGQESGLSHEQLVQTFRDLIKKMPKSTQKSVQGMSGRCCRLRPLSVISSTGTPHQKQAVRRHLPFEQPGMPCTAKHWLEALDMAVNRQLPNGARGQGLSLMSDNGCQPTSLAFMQTCATLEIHQAFTGYNNPKGNADTERLMRTLKEDCLWLREWTCPLELIATLDAWIITYNEQYLHSALGYKTPKQFKRDHYTSPSPPFLAA